MNYFAGNMTEETAKARYRSLAKEFHPDRGGDTAKMQAINAEYQAFLNRLKNPFVQTSYKQPDFTQRAQTYERRNAESRWERQQKAYAAKNAWKDAVRKERAARNDTKSLRRTWDKLKKEFFEFYGVKL